MGKRNWIDAADHLIFNVHYLFGLNLVKKKVMRGKKRHRLLDYVYDILLNNVIKFLGSMGRQQDKAWMY